ncbi:Bacterial membrane protein YfhO [compost metagenome]
MYFKDWKAFIDGKETPIYQVDYVLRGLEIPKGKHTIVFKFVPSVVQKGNKITLFFYLLLLVTPLIWWYLDSKKNKNQS